MMIIVFWILFSFVAAAIADRKGRGVGFVFLLSLLLSPLVGILVAVILSPNEQKMERNKHASGALKQCPRCAELVKKEAVVCRYCGGEFQAASPVARRVSAPVPAFRGPSGYNVARNGEVVGMLSMRDIRARLSAGRLDPEEDHYFDEDAKDWIPLSLLQI